ncbi:MAG TPA: cobyric acid synthase CobQ [Clostridiales bacterium]|nr:cobyric acid synthase CobQ [Clostridiales bacterium]
MPAKCIMVQGTASSVGKSLIVAGLCRIFRQDGYRVAPFKSQNMALNSFITADGKEMGRAQVVQAEAAGVLPSVEMNPILIKPTTDKKAQVIVNGEVYGNFSAVEYHNLKPALAELVRGTYQKLAEQYDVIVIEGAGSPAEINLRDKDLVNMGMAEMADAPVVLVGDIDKGGVFASLAGTMLLLKEEEKARVKGVIINKFRGDAALLEPGLKMLEEIIRVPALGVLPYARLKIDDEDSVTEKFAGSAKAGGSATGASIREATGASIRAADIDIAVLRLPHISNFTDFNPLEALPGVQLRYITDAEELGRPDMVILPGTKNTLEDLAALRQAGFEEALKRLSDRGTLVMGICGGYQMLGMEMEDPLHVESDLERISGLGLLPVRTVFQPQKVKLQAAGIVAESESRGILEGLEGCRVEGYEIHMGKTQLLSGGSPWLAGLPDPGESEYGQGLAVTDGGCRSENILGTYLHGIFDNTPFTLGLIQNLRRQKGLETPTGIPVISHRESKEIEYDKLADMLRENMDIAAIYRILEG